MPGEKKHTDSFPRYMKGFNLVNLELLVDWLNIMTYDMRK
jgi:GH18 family chitinase